MKRIPFPVLFILIISLSCRTIFAQNPDSTNRNIGIVAGYWGAFNNTPGLKLGIEKTYLESTKYSIIGSAALLLNRKPGVFTSAGFIFSSTLRRTWKRGIFLEHGINIGYSGNYYDFDIYKTNTEGDIVNIGRKWNSTMNLGYSIGLGYDFSKKTNINMNVFFKAGLSYDLLNKTNYYYANNYNIEIGLAFYPKWLNRNK
jgi:hypothetical protein